MRWTFLSRVVLPSLFCSAATVFAAESAPASAAARVIVVAGALGAPEFAPDFEAQLDSWKRTSAAAGAGLSVVGRDGDGAGPSDRDRLRDLLASEPREGAAELWIVLLGHGTFDGREAKVNLRGPDVSAGELGEWLKPFSRPVAVVHTTSSSAPFIAKLAAPGRVIVSATRSGNEQNYTRFGRYFAEALADPASDLDRDGQVSLLESFLSAANRTAEFYKTEGRLATEHPLVEDNGDGLGTPPDWFRGVLAVKRAADGAASDGTLAHQMHLVRSAAEQSLAPADRARRDDLERRLADLRSRKPKLAEDAYFKELETILLALAEVYHGR
jgi:hypothetical protein